MMIDSIDKKIIRVLQKGIPMTAEPFGVMAKECGISTTEFLNRLNDLKERGVLRRMGAVLQHRHAGYKANALCVWQVPEDQLDEAGKTISAENAVSHCYTRTTTPEWPYNFYTMIHAHTRQQCEEIAERIERENHFSGRRLFYSVKEWKKASMKYFAE